jgi:hypothetical protein
MSTVFVQFGEIDFPLGLGHLRNQAALVRALLDELDRVAPTGSKEPGVQKYAALGAQLAEELGRLGCRMLECAAAITGDDVTSHLVRASHSLSARE